MLAGLTVYFYTGEAQGTAAVQALVASVVKPPDGSLNVTDMGPSTGVPAMRDRDAQGRAHVNCGDPGGGGGTAPIAAPADQLLGPARMQTTPNATPPPPSMA